VALLTAGKWLASLRDEVLRRGVYNLRGRMVAVMDEYLSAWMLP
jgi:hypothetical protein